MLHISRGTCGLWVPFVRRTFSQLNKISLLPHLFSKEEAINKFQEVASKNIFSTATPDKQVKDLAISTDPLKKVYIPVWKGEVSIDSTDFTADYHIKNVSYILINGKVVPVVKIKTYRMTGSIGRCVYKEDQDGMAIYGGTTWSAHLVEKALSGTKTLPFAKPFNTQEVSKDITVDPFNKLHKRVREIHNRRIENLENNRVRKAIHNKVSCDSVEIISMRIRYASYDLSPIYLASYVLQYPQCSPRIMSAYSEKINIVGKTPLSVLKCASAATLITMIGTSILPLIYPPLAIPSVITRMSIIASTTFLTGSWAYLREAIQYRWDEFLMKSERKYIEQKPFVSIPLKYFAILDLDPSIHLTPEIIKNAFNKKILLNHPDKNKEGSEKMVRKLIKARNILLNSLEPTKK